MMKPEPQPKLMCVTCILYFDRVVPEVVGWNEASSRSGRLPDQVRRTRYAQERGFRPFSSAQR